MGVVSMRDKWAMVFAQVGVPGQPTVTQVCAELGVSRQTYYKWRRRYAEAGLDGLGPVSRRPVTPSARVVGEDMVERVVAARGQLAASGWDHGARSIYYRLLRDPTVEADRVPHPRTIHRILVRAGLVVAEPKKRPRSSYRSFVYPATDDCWQLDATQWRLADQTPVVIFHLIDDCSRYMLAGLVWTAETTTGAWECVVQAIRTYGPPMMVLTDNSLAFTGRRMGLEVLFEINLHRIGVKTIHSAPLHPQTCGKDERQHHTLQEWLRARPPAGTIAELQDQVEVFRHGFNHDRPHQALGGKTPAEQRLLRARLVPLPREDQPPPRRLVAAVADYRGNIAIDRWLVSLGAEFVGCRVDAFIVGWPGEERVVVFHRHHQLHAFTLDPTRRRQIGRRAATRESTTPLS